MTSKLTALTPKQVAERLSRGDAVLVDIREADEYARRHIAGALSRPLSAFDPAQLKIDAGKAAVFTCRSGMRTAAACDRLAAAAGGEAFILEGGVEGWAAAGLPVAVDRKAPLELMRQVQIAAGLLVLAGVILGSTVSPLFYGLSGFVGAGLTFAGVSGFCGMARMLALMPWNRTAAA